MDQVDFTDRDRSSWDPGPCGRCSKFGSYLCEFCCRWSESFDRRTPWHPKGTGGDRTGEGPPYLHPPPPPPHRSRSPPRTRRPFHTAVKSQPRPQPPQLQLSRPRRLGGCFSFPGGGLGRPQPRQPQPDGGLGRPQPQPRQPQLQQPQPRQPHPRQPQRRPAQPPRPQPQQPQPRQPQPRQPRRHQPRPQRPQVQQAQLQQLEALRQQPQQSQPQQLQQPARQAALAERFWSPSASSTTTWRGTLHMAALAERFWRVNDDESSTENDVGNGSAEREPLLPLAEPHSGTASGGGVDCGTASSGCGVSRPPAESVGSAPCGG